MNRSDNCRVVILGAGRNIKGGSPSAIVLTDENRRVLDWLLDSFSSLGEPDVHFIGGYRVEEVARHYPDIRFLFNPEWADTGPVRSLAYMPGDHQAPTYICYSDIVFRPHVVQAIEDVEGDIVLAVDSQWRVRYDSRTVGEMDSAEKVVRSDGHVVEIGKDIETERADAEFVGLMKFSPAVLERCHNAILAGEFKATAGVPELLSFLVREGFTASASDIQGDWAHLNAPQDLARFVLGTKAESLGRLRPLMRKGQIGEQVSFRHDQWDVDCDQILDHISQVFRDGNLIVRSSALSEDNWLQSSAGAYKSILNIQCSDRGQLATAIVEVIKSYDEVMPENQVLVQEMVADVVMSGVVMTRTPTMSSPYYVINFDTSGSTDSVTSGEGRSLRTIFLLRDEALIASVPKELHRLMEAVRELEGLVGHDSLDIEFAINKEALPHILQVRPIAVSHGIQPVDDERITAGVRDCQRLFRELLRPSALLVGSATQFSVMADWNPAEMIGTKPQPLAFSLYRHLITDESWATQRAEFGYRDVRPCNLIVDFLGHPYVDMRVDFNSFVPASLPDDLAARLVERYLDALSKNPELHDKVEFDIIMTCLSMDFDAQAKRLEAEQFNKQEIELIRASLLEITQAGIARCGSDARVVSQLEARILNIVDGTSAPLERAYLLLEDVRRVAIPLFSHLARHAFVAITLLKSLSKAGVINEDQLEAFLASMRTVPSLMQDHARDVVHSRLAWRDFVSMYGHLRPGSYDILSACYADAPGEFLQPVVDQTRQSQHDSPAEEPWNAEVRTAVQEAVESIGLEVSAELLMTFFRDAIEGREFAKFEFMRGVNSALEAIAEFGEMNGIQVEDLAQIRIQDLFSLRSAHAESPRSRLAELARRGREDSFVTQAACLPGQIFSEHDFVCFEQRAAEPNFITRKSVRAAALELAERSIPKGEISGCIILIANADPGYDWLFSRDIAGLITMYGGVNSHMAIRAAEFGLPAAIGVGELLYDDISCAEVLVLDCENRKIQVIR